MSDIMYGTSVIKVVLNGETVSFGPLALLAAAGKGYKEVVAMLLEAKANVDEKGPDDVTALIVAAFYGHKEVVAMLLEAKANVDAKGTNGITALIHAVRQGHQEIAAMLLQANANVNEQGSDSTTALITAVGNSHKEIVAILLQAKANVNIKGPNGVTSLMFAVIYGYKEMVTMLLQANANVNDQTFNGVTALMLAVNYGDQDIVEMLLKAKADVNARDINGLTALMYAVRNNKIELAKILIKLIYVKMPLDFDIFLEEVAFRLKLNLIFPIEFSKFSNFYNMQIPREGGVFADWLSILNNHINKYIPILVDEDEKKLYSTLNIMLQPNSEEVFCLSTYDEEISIGSTGHAETIIIKDDLLLQIERGGVRNNKPGIEIYEIPLNKVTEAKSFFIELRKQGKQLYDRVIASSQPQDRVAVLSKLSAISENMRIKGKHLNENLTSFNLIKQHSIEMKQQKTGNCSCATTKAIVLGILFLLIRKQLIEKINIALPMDLEDKTKLLKDINEQATHRAKILYKKFTTFLRLKEIEGYLLHCIKNNYQITDEKIIIGMFKYFFRYTKNIRDYDAQMQKMIFQINEIFAIECQKKSFKDCIVKDPIRLSIAAQKSQDEKFIKYVKGIILYDNLDALYTKDDLNNLVFFASRNNAKNLIPDLLRSGANIDALTDSGVTSLYDAVSRGDTAMVELFLKYSTNAKDQNPFIYAVVQGNTTMVELFLKYGTNAQNEILLSHAISKGNTAMVELFLKYGANGNLNEKKYWRNSLFSLSKSESLEKNQSIHELLTKAIYDIDKAIYDLGPVALRTRKRKSSVNFH